MTNTDRNSVRATHFCVDLNTNFNLNPLKEADGHYSALHVHVQQNGSLPWSFLVVTGVVQ